MAANTDKQKYFKSQRHVSVCWSKKFESQLVGSFVWAFTQPATQNNGHFTKQQGAVVIFKWNCWEEFWFFSFCVCVEIMTTNYARAAHNG